MIIIVIVLNRQKGSMSTYSEAYTQSPLAHTKRCLDTVKSQELRDRG